MRSVKIHKNQLLDIITTNRKDHRQIFLDAQVKYREEVISRLDAMLADARSGKKVSQYVGLIEPEDHTPDYDQVIRMLELSVDDIFELSSQEFGCYVQDKWDWSNQWSASNSNYVSHPKLGNA